MKKFLTRYAGVIAVLALAITTMTANSNCVWVMHQDELPEAAKKLRRF